MNKFKQLTIAGFIGGCMMSPDAMAKNYQSEVFYRSLSTDYPSETYEDSYGVLSYMHHFNGVDTSNKPLAEAAFLDRSRSIEAGLFNETRDYGTGAENTGGGFFVEYIHMDKSSPLILEILYAPASYERTDSSGATWYEYDVTWLELTAGWFLDYSTAVAVTMADTDVSFKTAAYANESYSTTDILIEAKKIMNPGGKNPINIHGKVGFLEYGKKAESNTAYEVLGDYYLDRMKSVGASYKIESGDGKDYEGTTIGVHGQFFFTEQFSLKLDMKSFSAKNTSGADSDSVDLILNYRF